MKSQAAGKKGHAFLRGKPYTIDDNIAFLQMSLTRFLTIYVCQCVCGESRSCKSDTAKLAVDLSIVKIQTCSLLLLYS